MSLILRHPTLDDVPAVHALVRASPLDDNSAYAYAVGFHHHGRSCVIGALGAEVVGFVLGHRVPDRPDTQFVWQIGVAPQARGQGIATRMLHWLAADAAADEPPVRWVEATVTPDNRASRALFLALARDLGASCEIGPGFPAEVLGPGHLREDLFRIGPIPIGPIPIGTIPLAPSRPTNPRSAS